MHNGLILCGKGIQVSPNYFKPIEYLVGVTLLCAFEEHMLEQMRESYLGFLFISRTCINKHTTMRNLSILGLLVGQSKAIRKCMKCVFHAVCRLNDVHSRKFAKVGY